MMVLWPKAMSRPQHSQALIQSGLTPAQASLYEALIQHGTLNARRASFIAGIPRTLGYKILGELEQLGLVVKNDKPKSVSTFSAVNPLKLKKLAEKKVDEAVLAKKVLDEALFKLVSDFNKASGPGAQTFEGGAGLKEFIDTQIIPKKPLITTIIEDSPAKLTFSVIFEAL